MTRSRGTRLVALLAAGVLCAGLVSCAGGEDPEADPSLSAPSSTSTEPGPTETAEPEEDGEGTAIRILVDGQVLGATLWDTPAAKSLADQLPLTLEFAPYGSQEVTATPPAPITMDGMPEGDAPVAGDIGYYAPDGVVTFHFTDIGYFTGSARLGQVHGSTEILQGRSGPFPVTIERAG